jgi:signal transduction histidine kinase
VEGVKAASTRPVSHPSLVDVGFAGAVGVVVLGVSWKIGVESTEPALDAPGALLVVGAAASLAWRRVAPAVVGVVASVIVALYALGGYAGGPIFLVPLVPVYTLATIEGGRRSLPIALVAGGLPVIASVTHGLEAEPLVGRVLYVSWIVGALLLGDSVRSRRAELAALEERARYLEETRDEEARRRVAEERLRIARDLHDVMAHSLASINIQSGAGAHVLHRHPEQALDSLLAIKQASKVALDELRATLGMLRGDEGGAPRAPAPGLADLAMLTGGAERAGVPVQIECRGQVSPLPPATDLAAYRIIQESLTNVMRHAGATKAQVGLTYEDDSLRIEVSDDGRGPAHSANGGHGIIGMRERAAMVGGSLEVGPRAEGGFRVLASLPLQPRHSVPT